MREMTSSNVARLEGQINAFERDMPRAMCRPALQNALEVGAEIMNAGTDGEKTAARDLIMRAATRVMQQARSANLGQRSPQEIRLWAEIGRCFMQSGAPVPHGFSEVMRWSSSGRTGRGVGSTRRIEGSHHTTRRFFHTDR